MSSNWIYVRQITKYNHQVCSMDENMFNKIKLWSTNDKMSHQNKIPHQNKIQFHLMNIIWISLVLFILQTILIHWACLMNIICYLMNRSCVNLIHRAYLMSVFLSFNERICNLMNEFYVDEFCYQKPTIENSNIRNICI